MTFNTIAVDHVRSVIRPELGVTVSDIATQILKDFSFDDIPEYANVWNCAVCLALAITGTNCHITKNDDSLEIRIIAKPLKAKPMPNQKTDVATFLANNAAFIAQRVKCSTLPASVHEDITQDINVRIMEAYDQYDPKFAATTWLTRVCQTVISNAARSKQRETAKLERYADGRARTDGSLEYADDAIYHYDPSRAAIKRQEDQMLNKAISNLSTQDQQILNAWQNRSVSAYASATGTDQPTISRKAASIRKQLALAVA